MVSDCQVLEIQDPDYLRCCLVTSLTSHASYVSALFSMSI